MRTTDLILAAFLFALTLMSALLLFPRFRRHARWQPGYIPMSLRSRLLLPLFPASLTLGALGLYRGIGILLAIVMWIIGFLSYLGDRKSYSKQKPYVG
jgi:hypothetical protein